MGVAALEHVGAEQVLGSHLSLFNICNIGRRSVAVKV